jgi:hypothetical protein
LKPIAVAFEKAIDEPAPLPIAVEPKPGALAPWPIAVLPPSLAIAARPTAVLLIPVADAPFPTAVEPDMLAAAWQFAPPSRKVVVLFAVSPDWHPAIAGAAARLNIAKAMALLA